MTTRPERYETNRNDHRWLTTLALGGSLLVVGLGGTACTAPQADASDAVTAEDSRSGDDSSLLEDFFGEDPHPVTVPAGTTFQVRFDERLSSHESQPGQAFTVAVVNDLRIADETAIPAGSKVRGTVTDARPAKKIGGRALLALSFESVVLPDGSEEPIGASFVRTGKSETAKDAAIIGGSTLGGAVLGESIDDGEGGVLGAIVGGLAGAAAAKHTQGKPLVIEPGTVMTLELQNSLTVEVS